MNGTLEVVLLCFLTAWLIIVSLLLAGLARYIGRLASIIAQNGNIIVSDETAFRVDDDGPEIPSALPSEAAQGLRQVNVPIDDRALLVLFSVGCAPCEDRIQEIAELQDRPGIPFFALMAGSPDKSGLTKMVDALTLTGFTIITDPLAHDLATALSLQSVPFALLIEKGSVVAKTYLRHGADLERMWDPADAASRTEGIAS